MICHKQTRPAAAGLMATGLLAAAFLALSTGGALAAGGEGAGSEALLIAQVTVLVIVGRAMGEVMQRLGQPSILGQILGGILLGPSVFGMLWPEAQTMLFPPVPLEQNAMITGLSQVGILFLLLLAGMETDLGLALRLRKQALSVSMAGIAVPFACGVTLGLLMPQELLPHPEARLVTSLFLGTALSISSVKIVATVVREMNFMRRNLGQLIVATAIIDDTVGWVIIAITFSLATSGTIDAVAVSISVVGTLAFLAISFTIGRRLVFEIIRWTNDTLQSDVPVVSAIVAIMGVMALLTSVLGVQTVLGAFVAGILVGQSPILTRQIDEQIRGLTTALFMPVFFGLTGLHTNLAVLADPGTLALAVGLIVIASIGKFGGAFLGARINRLTMPEALALGFGMNARGSTEVIVASVGLSVGVLDERLFSVIVAMAVVTTLVMPPTLRWALARLPVRKDEKERLDREGFEEQSHVSQLERVLAVADDSRSGHLATRLAGSFAGVRQTPVTVLDLTQQPPPPVKEEGKGKDKGPDKGRDEDKTVDRPADQKNPAPATAAPAQSAAADRVRAAAEVDPPPTDEAQNGAPKTPPHVGLARSDGDIAATVAAEAGKGHDLMFVGTEPVSGAERGFSPEIENMVAAFGGSTIIVSARGTLRRNPEAALRLLVPVSGDALSTRAMEFACIIAKAHGARIAAYFSSEQRGPRSAIRMRGDSAERAVFANVERIAEHYGVAVKLLSGEGTAPAILGQARKGRHTLVVVGVGARTSERLSFGPVADALLDQSDRSLAFFMAGETAPPAPRKEEDAAPQPETPAAAKPQG